MEIYKLVAVFCVLIAALRFKRTLLQALLLSILTTILLFGIDIATSAKITLAATVSWQTISLILVLYFITFLQRMLESRNQLRAAERDLYGIFNSRRINVMFAPAFIGLLPSAAAALICGDIVDHTCGDDLEVSEKAFVTSYFRHIPESFLPTYPSIIIMSQLCGVPVQTFVVGMLPLVATLFTLGYVFYLRKLSPETGEPASQQKFQSAISLVKHLWTLIFVIVLIIAFNIPVLTAVCVACVISVFVYKFKVSELLPMFKSAFDTRLVMSTFMIMVFKEFITETGVINLLPEFFSALPIPTFLIFALLYFFGTMIGSSMAIIATCTVMAFSAVPGSGMPLMVLLMSFTYAASQLSPTHICLVIVSEFYKIGLGSLIKKTIPVIATFCTVAVGYYLLLTMVF